MKCVRQSDGKSGHKIRVKVMLLISVAVLCVGSIYLRKRNMWIAEDNQRRREEERVKELEAYWEEVEKEYIEFEKLFRKNEDDMQNFIETSRGSILEEEAYYMLFDNESYSSVRSDEEWITILYEGAFSSKEDREDVKALDKNVDLKEALDCLRKKGVISSVSLFYLEKEMPMVIFWVNTEFTPFVTSNNGIINCFVWCENKDCEKYGYRNVEDNWYMHIEEPPE